MKPVTNQLGFTLIELLVVISIISLLATLAATSMQNAQKKARDAKRLSDLRQLSTAIKLLADSQGGIYFSTSGTGKCLGFSNEQTCWNGSVSGSDSLNAALAPYIKIPSDPLSGSRTRGNAYIYGDSNSNTAWHCNGTSYPKGPYLIWLPDNNSAYSDADCKGLGFYACCGSAAPCAEGYYCAYIIE